MPDNKKARPLKRWNGLKSLPDMDRTLSGVLGSVGLLGLLGLGVSRCSWDGSFSGRREILRGLGDRIDLTIQTIQTIQTILTVLMQWGAFPDRSLILGFSPAGRTAQLFAEQFIHEPGHRHAPFLGFVVEAGDEESINRGRVVPK